MLMLSNLKQCYKVVELQSLLEQKTHQMGETQQNGDNKNIFLELTQAKAWQLKIKKTNTFYMALVKILKMKGLKGTYLKICGCSCIHYINANQGSVS